MEVLLPRMGPHGESEDRAVLAPLQAVGAGRLRVGPADRELDGAIDLAVHNRTLADCRADHLVTGISQRVQPVPPDDYGAARRVRPLSFHRSSLTAIFQLGYIIGRVSLPARGTG